MKRDSLDTLFSDYIRARDGWRCQRCGKHYPPPTKALHCAHIFSRGKQSIRFYSDNATALCYGCHRYLDQRPEEKKTWWRERIGEERYNALLLKMAKTQKTDKALIGIWLKQELKKQGGER